MREWRLGDEGGGKREWQLVDEAGRDAVQHRRKCRTDQLQVLRDVPERADPEPVPLGGVVAVVAVQRGDRANSRFE